MTTSVNNDLLLLAVGTDSDKMGYVTEAGYSWNNNCNVNQEPDQKLCVAQRRPIAIGTYTGNWTLVPDSWEAALVAYKPGGGTLSDTTPPAAPPPAPTELTIQ